MIEIGSTVDATITRVEPYGLFLTHDDDSIFVPANNIAWVPTPTTMDAFRVGDSLSVVIERLNSENNTYAGSVKHLHPEENPYAAISLLPPNTVLEGMVKMVHQHGVSVETENRCIGELPLTDDTRALQKGAQVNVQVTALDVENQRMSLQLIDSPQSD